MSVKLPFEILGIISSYVSRRDMIRCLTVCKSWRAPFEDALWETIEIDGYGKMVAICSNLTTLSTVYQKNGHRVRTLTLCGHMWIVNEELCIIQQYFHKLKHLNIRPSALSWYDFGKLANWDSWKSLTRLEIHMTELTGGDKEEEIIEMLASLPNLRHLYLDDDLPLKKEHFTWRAIEKIHLYLPLLEYFEMGSPLVAISQHDLPDIKYITPASNLAIVKINYGVMDLGWLYYCAIKYPSIHTFGWKIKEDNKRPLYLETTDDEPSDEESQQIESLPVRLARSGVEQKKAISMFSKLAYFFPHLKIVELNDKPNSEWQHTVFWKLIRQFRVPLKCVDYDFYNTDIDTESSGKIMNEHILACSNSLEALRLRAEVTALSSVLGTCADPMYPSVYSCLVDLHISLVSKEIELDILLNHCPVLRWLHLSARPIILSAGSLVNPATHGLKRIKIEDAKVDWRIFSYISLRCKYLSHMSLFDVAVCGPISQETGNLCLDMSHTHFKDLKLVNVDFYSLEDMYTEEYQCADELINFISFEQTESAHSKVFDTQGPLNTPSENHTQSTWFHLCLSSINKTHQELRKLEQHQIELAQKYFQSFHNKDHNLSTEDAQYKISGPVDKNGWAKDLSHGYVTLRCAYSLNHLISAYYQQ